MDQPQETAPGTDQSVVASAPSDQRMAMAAEYAAYAAENVQAAQNIGSARLFLLKANGPQDECDMLAFVQARLHGRAEEWMKVRRIVLECEGIS
ncbi:hypothetical protein FPV16_17915 [Methylobacterium sp. W2]|uniref:hypothetical protein n=1 Tax=Methylobacterium sp. W2 TaxID=2598107 RepID=UPI001D0C427D|nr:hypothetical protein [Methylobacterium sp. W2]MCC0808064.1 hypothetical protein [Methylobacterium sp. W2]